MPFGQDLRSSARAIARRPEFSVVVLATLALTIGAATTVYSLFDAVLLRPFPYGNPERLVRIQTEQPQLGVTGDVSVYDFWDWQREAKSVSGMACYVTYSNNLTGDGPAKSVRMTFATPELFSILGVSPLLGSLYTSADDKLGGKVRQAILSHALWQQRFNGRRDIIDTTIHLRGQSYTVAGVMPAGFGYPDRTEVWVPLMARYSTYTDAFWKRRDTRPHSVLARLRDGVSLAQAGGEMKVIAARQAAQFPDTNRGFAAKVITLREAETGQLRPYVLMVGGAVFLLLLIGCVNVANLFVARAASRGREFAIRAALGSGLSSLIRQLLAESLWYGVFGGALGVAVSWAGVRALMRLIPVDLPNWMVLTLDARILAFAVGISLLTSVIFGLAPLIQSFRPDLNEVLKQGSKGSSGERTTAGTIRKALVIAEVALSLVLLVGAGLLLRSFSKVMQVDTGMRTENLVVASIGRYMPNVTPEQALVGYANEVRRMVGRLAAIPGVSAVSSGNDVPYLKQPEERGPHTIYTRQRATRDLAYRGPGQGADVTPGYFATLGIPFLEGRDFTDADTVSAQKAIIISKGTAELLFPGHSAIGEQIRWGNNDEYDPWTTVIGVVGNTRWHPAERKPGVEVYWSYRQYPSPNTNLLVRTTVNPENMIETIRRVVREVNPEFAIELVKTMDNVVDESVWQRRLWGFVLTAFAGLALLLAAVGLYGVMSYLVEQRTRELGIRLAIGARPSRVVGLVLGGGLKLVSVGIGLGLGLAFLGSKYIARILFGVSATDPVTFLVVPVVLLTVALTACAVPAVRAASIDPLRALRQE